MAKLTLTDISSGYLSTTTFNANNTLIEAALENTLSRDGTSPNTMSANLDMNSNKIVNLTDPTNNQDAATKAYVDGVTGGIDTLDELTDVTLASETTGDVLRYNGTVWVNYPDSNYTGLANVVEDTTPQLGGNLDVNTNSIVSTSNGNITLAPNGTGNVVLGTMTIDGDQTVGAGQDNYVLTYDHGLGLVALEAAAGGGLANVVEDVTPQLGGTLDMNGQSISSAASFNITLPAEGYITLPGTGGIRYQDTGTQTTLHYQTGAVMTTVAGAGTTSWQLNNIPLDCNNNELRQAKVKDYGLTSNSLTVSANAVSVDLSTGNAFEIDLEAATGAVTITLSNPPASGTYGECCLKIQQDTTAARTITWAGGTFKWPGGTVPTMSAAADALDIFIFKTWDGGTTWFGNASQAYA